MAHREMTPSDYSDAVVKLSGVNRIYDSAAGPVQALNGVDMEVFPGELAAVIGPSGSGKSTLLNTLGLLDRPSSGRYLLGGEDTALLPERARTALRARMIGFIFQSFHLIGHKTALANVMLPLSYSGVPSRQRPALAEAALRSVDMGHRLHAFPNTLSGGEKQRVAIARATVTRPLLLLCDEPTGNLDTKTSARVLELLRARARDGLAIVVVTHDLAVADSADRIMRVQDGRLTNLSRDSDRESPVG